MSNYTIETSIYKGHPTISILKDGNRVFSCGAKKAQAIVDNFEALKEFAEANTEKVDAEKLPEHLQELLK